MHPTNLPLMFTSLSFLLPYFAAHETNNPTSAFVWGTLTVTSTLVHTTKQPYHLYGPGNCIGWLYAVDTLALYAATARAVVDAWAAGPVSRWMAGLTILYASAMFYGGHAISQFVYSPSVEMAILSHATTHLLAAWGGTTVLYARALR
jgi:hypothetical protein